MIRGFTASLLLLFYITVDWNNLGPVWLLRYDCGAAEKKRRVWECGGNTNEAWSVHSDRRRRGKKMGEPPETTAPPPTHSRKRRFPSAAKEMSGSRLRSSPPLHAVTQHVSEAEPRADPLPGGLWARHLTSTLLLIYTRRQRLNVTDSHLAQINTSTINTSSSSLSEFYTWEISSDIQSDSKPSCFLLNNIS